MSYLKRLTVSLRSQVEQLVSQVEDHEAVVDAAINDAGKTLADSRVRINRVRRDGDKLQRQISELQQASAKWRDRARQTAQQDENTALECLRRAQEADAKIESLERVFSEHKQQQEQLQAIICDAETRLQEKIQRRNLMSTRESALKTSQNIAHTETDCAETWDTALERWETRIAEMEVQQDLAPAGDALEYQFINQEQKAALKADLQELMQQEADRD